MTVGIDKPRAYGETVCVDDAAGQLRTNFSPDSGDPSSLNPYISGVPGISCSIQYPTGPD